MSSHLSCFLLLCTLLPALLTGEQCKPDPLLPCKAQCNGTTFDLTLVFDFPMNISGFIWNPCKGFNCTSTQTGLDCAVCQNIVLNYNVSCGKMSNPVWIWDVLEKNHEPGNWRIEYTFGDDWRISVFEFILDENGEEEPTILFLGEVPMLQYNFRVVGKCLGQPSIHCSKYYEQRKISSH